jgi:hypothetical protein
VSSDFGNEFGSVSITLPQNEACTASGIVEVRETRCCPSMGLFDNDPDIVDSDDGSALQRIDRMLLRKQSPKIRRRKRRSKVPVDPISQELEEDEALFYQSQLTQDGASRQLEASTTRIERATDRFMHAIGNMRGVVSRIAMEALFSDQGHPASNEIKDAIDEGFAILQRCYPYYVPFLMAFLALPPLPTNYVHVATFCGAMAQHFGCHHVVSSDDHAAAHFYNVLRYFQKQHPEEKSSGGFV